MPPQRTPLTPSYIWDRVIPEPNSGCWLWLGPVGNAGYAVINLKGRRMNAQRGSYIAHFGPVSAGLDVDHLCRNTLCVNPEHLEAVTHRENCRRRSAHITTCRAGHPYDYIDIRGHRRCRQCDRAQKARAILKRAEGK